MKSIPDERELYRRFDERGHQMIPGTLMSYFEEDVHSLVSELKRVIEYTLSDDERAFIDLDAKIIRSLESWKSSKEKHIAHERYKKFAANNLFNGDSLTFENFISQPYYSRWQKIEALGLEVGLKVEIKGYGDKYTVRGISSYLTVCVNGISQHIDPMQIVSVG